MILHRDPAGRAPSLTSPPVSPHYLPGTIREGSGDSGGVASVAPNTQQSQGSYSPVPRVPREHRPCQPGVQTEPRGTPPVRPGRPACCAGDTARAPHSSPGDSPGARAWIRSGPVQPVGEQGP